MFNTILKVLLMIMFISKNIAFAYSESFEQDLKRFTPPGSAGYSVLISQKNKVIFRSASGMANIELAVPLKPTHLFEIGSLTKQFTAVAILHLAQQGKLSLDDTIDKYMPKLNTHGHKVTIKHLLSHTSGLNDFVNQPEIMSTRLQESMDLDKLIDEFQNLPWLFQPGSNISYTNQGYAYLAKIIELVSEQSYIDYLTINFFIPLKINHTFQWTKSIITNKVKGHTYTDSKIRNSDFLDVNWAYGAANLVSTVDDLNKWNHALMKGEILSPSSLKIFLSPVLLDSGENVGGSYNFEFGNVGKLKTIFTSGSTFGFSSSSFYLPQKALYIVVLSNSDGIGGTWVLPATVASKLMATHLKIELPKFNSTKVNPKLMKNYIGNYKLESGSIRKITYHNNKVFYQRDDGQLWVATPMEENGFYFKENLNYFKFKKDKQGHMVMEFYYFLNDEAETAVKL